MLLAGDRILLAKFQDDLQYLAHSLNQVASELSTKVETEKKTTIITSRGIEPIVKYELLIGYWNKLII
jgi:hypothetical protein